MSGNLSQTLKLARSREVESEPEAPTPKLVQRDLPMPKQPSPAGKGRGGKSSNPDYRKIGIYVRRDWMQKLEIHLATQGGKEDVSDFFETIFEPAIKRLGE